MKRGVRLSKSADVKRVRRSGKPYAHPFVVLFSAENGLEHTRVAVSADRSIGNAVQRNRAKRVLRAAMAPLMDSVKPGQDILLQARAAIVPTKSHEVRESLKELLRKAKLLR